MLGLEVPVCARPVAAESVPGTGDEVYAAPQPAISFDLAEPDWYANRELSWLDFNDRVLAEAMDPRNPLLERVRFLAITARNLDEFYLKRVGWLKLKQNAEADVQTVDGLTIDEQTRLTIARGAEMRRRMDRLWSDELEVALAEIGVTIVPFLELDRDTRGRLSDHFSTSILPVLTPLVVDPMHPFPFISGGSLSVMLDIREPGTDTWRFARIKVPPNLQRFVAAGDGRFVLIEDLIGSHREMLFQGAEVSDWYVARVLRSAEIDDSAEAAQDLRELIVDQLEQRRLAGAVTLQLSLELPPQRLASLLDGLGLEATDTVVAEHLIGKGDLDELAALPLSGHQFRAIQPIVPSVLEEVAEAGAFFAVLRQQDVLVHHPYQSFDATVARFIEEAASDPQVLAIKQTMYRTSPDSPMLEALIAAARRGKQVAVVVELTASFDEANNLQWARKLEDAGVHIAYGRPNLKVHSKIALVVREEPGGVMLYAHVGTGNYNSRTARVYTDLGLLTADPAICSDLVGIFNGLTGFALEIRSETLLVAPTTLRSELERRVRREMELARSGRPARLLFKMNALEDVGFTRLLYQASQAGVQVDLLVRGLCRLRPGIRGLSENLRVVSVIGRFLEHSRIYHFENDGDPECFIGSADLMKRNLDERLEVLTPVRQPDLVLRLKNMAELMLADRRQGWELSDQTWSRDEACATTGSHELLHQRPEYH